MNDPAPHIFRSRRKRSITEEQELKKKKNLFYLPLCVPLSTCAINSQVRFWRPTILCSTSSCPSAPSVLRWWHTVVVQCYRLSRSARHTHRWDFYIRLNYSMIFYESLFNGSFKRLRFCNIKWQDGCEQRTEDKAERTGSRLPSFAYRGPG